MIVQDLVVIVGAVVLSGALAWFFFGPRRARAAELVGDVQQVRVTVRGGYSPDLVRRSRVVSWYSFESTGRCPAGANPGRDLAPGTKAQLVEDVLDVGLHAPAQSQLPVAGLAHSAHLRHQERPVHQPLDQVRDLSRRRLAVGTGLLGRLDRESGGQDRKPVAQGLLQARGPNSCRRWGRSFQPGPARCW